MKKNLAMLLAVMLALLVLAGCGGKAEAPTETVDEAVWGTAPEETKGIEVQTDFFTFEYPQEWDGKVEEVRTQEGNNAVITFRTKISGKEVVLFSIILGPDQAEGYLLGQLVEGESSINVYSLMNEMPASDWTDEEYDEICALQERVNEIIIQFHEDDRFVPNR